MIYLYNMYFMNYIPLIFVDTWMKPTQLYIVLLMKWGGGGDISSLNNN